MYIRWSKSKSKHTFHFRLYLKYIEKAERNEYGYGFESLCVTNSYVIKEKNYECTLYGQNQNQWTFSILDAFSYVEKTKETKKRIKLWF